VKHHRAVRRSGSRKALALTLGTLIALTVTLGLAAWLYAGPASARPGNSCDPEPGHGRPGCHVGATPSTTQSPVSTTVGGGTGTGDTTVDPVQTTTSVIPSVGPSLGIDPSAPRTYVDHNNCLSCHGDPSLKDLMVKTRPDGSSVNLFVDPDGLEYSVHRFNDCTTCHSSKPHEVETPLTKLSLAEKCGSCHQYQYDQHKNSIHGAPLAEGNSDPATCVDCHSNTSNPHNIVRVLEPAASTYPRNIAETCAKCHDDSELMSRYGIVEKVYDSYMRSFHGKAMSLSGESAALQQLDKATCVNCHGSHNIKLVSDPNSPVAGMDNLAKTCEQCHPGAGVGFAEGFLGHQEAEPDHIPVVFWGEKFFFVFTRVVLAGGVVLVVAPFGRRVVDRIKPSRKKPPTEEQQQDQAEEEE